MFTPTQEMLIQQTQEMSNGLIVEAKNVVKGQTILVYLFDR